MAEKQAETTAEKKAEEKVDAKAAKKAERAAKKAAKKANKKPNFLVRTGRYLRDCKNEIKKIVWPTPKATFRNTGVVLVVIIVIGLFIFGLDYGLTALLGTFMGIAH